MHEYKPGRLPVDPGNREVHTAMHTFFDNPADLGIWRGGILGKMLFSQRTARFNLKYCSKRLSVCSNSTRQF
jgi:hypothetical protein